MSQNIPKTPRWRRVTAKTAISGPQRGREISPSPSDPPKTSKSRIAAAGGRTIGSREVRKLRKLLTLPMSQKIPEKSPVAPSYFHFLVFLPPLKPANRELPEKLADTTQRRQSKKVAQCERASDEPKMARRLPGGAELRPKTCPKEARLGFGPVSGQVWPNSDRFWPDDEKN